MADRPLVHAILPATVFLAPVAMRPDRFTHPSPWLGALIAFIVLASQPPVDLREASSHGAADRGSALAILIAMIVAQLAASIEFARSVHTPGIAVVGIGAVIATGGLTLRVWAIRTLGRFFTSTVRVVDGQRVVRSGPYCLLRHPSYTGALLAALGAIIALGSVIGGALLLGLCVPAYLYRITVEERALIEELGRDYADYRRGSWGLVPGLR